VNKDPIIDEVRAVRDAIAKEHEYSVASIFRMLRDAEKRSGRARVSPPPPKVEGLPKAAQLHVAADETLASLRSRG
jgi:hypothetical protein